MHFFISLSSNSEIILCGIDNIRPLYTREVLWSPTSMLPPFFEKKSNFAFFILKKSENKIPNVDSDLIYKYAKFQFKIHRIFGREQLQFGESE